MKRIDLPANIRERVGKGSARSARRNGLVPAIVYGGDDQPTAVSVDRYTVEMELMRSESENMLVNLKVEGKDDVVLTLIRDTQHNPLSGVLEHVDFQRIRTDETIRTTVPLHTQGSAVGVRNGGIFEQVLREIEIECLPLDIPDELVVDIAEMEINDTLHVSDIPASDKYQILTDPDRAVANVASPESLTVPTAAEEGLEEAAAEEEGAEETEAPEGETE